MRIRTWRTSGSDLKPGSTRAVKRKATGNVRSVESLEETEPRSSGAADRNRARGFTRPASENHRPAWRTGVGSRFLRERRPRRMAFLRENHRLREYDLSDRRPHALLESQQAHVANSRGHGWPA